MTYTVCDALAALLVEYGVETVYGVPGNHTVWLQRALAVVGIRHVTARHEQGAAFMADGHARATGRPGVCLVIDGPGLLNAATAIAQARADSVPMLVLSSAPPLRSLGMGQGRLHELDDPAAVARAVGRQSLTIFDAANLNPAVHRAFVAMACARPGPVHLQIPLDLMTAPAPAPAAGVVPARPTPAACDVAAAAKLLRRARRPVTLLGGGSIGAADRIQGLIERLGSPVFETVNGKGVCPSTHPLAVGGSPSLPCIAEALSTADAVLAIGTELAETDFDLLMTPLPPISSALIRVDLDPAQLTRNAPPRVGLLGDARSAVDALVEHLPIEPAVDGAARARRLRAAVRSEPHWHPEMQAFFDALCAAAPDTIIVGDSTRPTYYAAWQLACAAPRRYWHSASGFGTLGYALPAAIGARIATRKPVISLIGDGGLQFTLAELSTAAQARLGLPLVVWHNDGYGEIANSLKAIDGPVEVTRVAAPDLAAVAQAHGCAHARPVTLDELTRVVRAALDDTRPTVIEAREDIFTTRPSGQWYGG